MRVGSVLFTLGALLALSSGCVFVPKTKLTASETQNRALSEQNRAQLTEIENLKVHTRDVEEQLARTEQRLALFQQRVGLDGEQLANYERIDEELQAVRSGPWRMASEVSRRLEELTRRYPSLHFDPTTGVSKFDTDVLFDSGEAELKPQAQTALADLAAMLKTPEAQDLHVMVVGHTDDEPVAKLPGRRLYPNNYHLSSARALAVADFLRQQGVAGQRVAVSSYGDDQPIAPNATPRDQQKNRRVEIFVMAREVPVVGWTETMPSVY